MSNADRVWIIDDDKSIRWVLEKALNQAGISTACFENANGVLKRLNHEIPNAIISDIRMPGISGLELLEALGRKIPEVPIIITTAHSDLESAVASYQGGAFEYLPKPFDVDDATAVTQRALLAAKANTAAVSEAAEATPEIIGEAAAMQEVFRAIGRLSQTNISVMINGESGTGKELVAKALHRHSPRHSQPFIALNMAAIPKDLMESELFGHEKGAFTGADQLRKGRFEQADGGTLFLDEIGDMPADTQTRLLRVLADGEFYRVGGHTPVTVDVRIIAATHQNLEQRVAAHSFREDLYHRLNVIRIQLPRLADRREDITRLAEHFLQLAAQELEVEPRQLTRPALDYLTKLPWPGNVRQLENTCRWLTVMGSGRDIHLQDLPPELLDNSEAATETRSWQEGLSLWAERELALGHKAILDTVVPEFERVMIAAALKHSKGRKRDAARLLGWGRNTLSRKLKELGE